MAVEWFNKEAGDDFLQSKDDPAMQLVGCDCPDWVTVPADTGYGGRYRCLQVILQPCPLHPEESCKHYILDGPVWCAECTTTKQFLWYKPIN